MSIDRHPDSTTAQSPHAADRDNSLRSGSTGRLIVRRAESERELWRFEQWSAMAGHADPRMLVDLLIGFHRTAILGSVLTSPATEPIQQLLKSKGGVPAAVAARTAVLVAVLDGHIVGGIIAGPSWAVLTQVLSADRDKVMAALLKTSELQIVGVDDEHRERGVGKTLVDNAIDVARAAKARIFYGRFDTERRHLTSFYRSCGLTVQHPGIGLDFTDLADIPLYLPATTEERSFFTTLHR
ncbi:GNAT family N-acetyltransferase [Nocardia sputi]|uniref:GNAT family N-acetyltransferase n=1 Tax=Nocardia sputi TaxID=2943705 RepID=UPI0020C07ED6|nr:GNAT family N-acetyltransferase [Nocardia sputi]